MDRQKTKEKQDTVSPGADHTPSWIPNGWCVVQKSKVEALWISSLEEKTLLAGGMITDLYLIKIILFFRRSGIHNTDYVILTAPTVRTKVSQPVTNLLKANKKKVRILCVPVQESC